MGKRGKVIFVTGSTGFLGSAVTRRLLDSGYKIKLLVRKRDNVLLSGSIDWESVVEDRIIGNHWENRIDNNNKYSSVAGHYGAEMPRYAPFLNNVEIINGDITLGNLGLQKHEYRRLSYEVDEVFHCAAVTQFERQEDKKHITVNVKGTENVLRFSHAGRQKRFHYVSTAYVAGRQNCIIYEKEMVTEPLFNNEYERSKFIAEQTVTQYAKTNEIPYTIYRPSIIVGDSKTGVTCKFDNLYLFAKVLLNVRNFFSNQKNEEGNDFIIRVPGDPDALINLVPVDYVADAIVAIIKQKEIVGKIFHITNPKPPSLRELRNVLISILEFKGIKVEIDGKAERKHLSAIERLFLRQTRSYYPYLFCKLRFDVKNTQKALNGTGIFCPVVSKELLRVFLDYAVSHNWGERKKTRPQEVEMVER